MTPERTRFAPSPTGLLHIGSLRTALYAYFLARQSEGVFILRIEDTDQKRSVPRGVEQIVETLALMGIVADEGPRLVGGELVEHGDHGPYLQSRRLERYHSAAQHLVENGHAYYCFCTTDDLALMRDAQRAAQIQPRYDGRCRELDAETVHARLRAGEAHVVRLRVPEGETAFRDIIRGTVTFANKEIDDQVLVKADGFPTYHLAVVVDDADMRITTVVRGEEWLSSTPKHVMLYDALSLAPPRFAHLPLLLGTDKSKLSKRQGDVSVASYVERGYVPEALLNFVATLGFNPRGDRELYALDELIAEFRLPDVKKSGAIVSFEKLDWMNRQYIQAMPRDELRDRLQRVTSVSLPENMDRIMDVERTRVTTLLDLAQAITAYNASPIFEDPQMIIWKKSNGRDTIEILKRVRAFIQSYEEEITVATLESDMKEWIAQEGLVTGNVLWPLRVALSGRERSASPFEYAYVLGKEEVVTRITHAIATLER